MSQQSGTSADDYSRYYYEHSIGDSPEFYDWSSPGWREFFIEVAARTLAVLPDVKTVLDVGCAKGLLVQALVEKGADAKGFDPSPAAVGDADEAIKDRLWVASATDPIEGRYDLVTCIEVVEHISPPEVERAIDNMCAASDRILLTSTPLDFVEPTHINVHPPADWAAAFAARGFYRRTDVDLAFLTPWAVLFEKAALSTRDVVHRYETLYAPTRAELITKREELLKAHRTISAHEDGLSAERERELESEQRRQLQHELMRLRDHAIGAEAAVTTARREAQQKSEELDEARQELHRLRAELEEIHESETWRVMRLAVKPMSVVKRAVRGAGR